MAKAPKIPDPAEAALSAIEEALSAKATGTDGPAPVRASKAKTPEPVLTAEDLLPKETDVAPPVIEPAKTEAPAPRQQATGAPLLPPTTVANDDSRVRALPLAQAPAKASSLPLVTAWTLGLLWLCAVAAYILSIHQPATALTGGLFGSANVITTGALILAGILPPLMMIATASMIRRAQELRLAARAMTDAALRISQPEIHATDSVFSLGQAVRREVASMGDGIERAVARASELEALVHSEVAQLERSYTDNELRIRRLLDDLSSQQNSFGDSAEQLRRSISDAQESLTAEIRMVSQKITESVADAGQRVASEMDHRGEAIVAQIVQAGDTINDRISVTGSVTSDRLQQVAAEISDRFAEGTQKAADQMETLGIAITQRFTHEAETVSVKISEIGDATAKKLETSAQGVTTALMTTGDALVSALGQRGDEVNATLISTGEVMVTSLGQRGEDVSATLRATGEALVIDLGIRGNEIAHRIEDTGTRIADLVATRGENLATRLTETSDRINEAVTTHGQALEESIASIGEKTAQTIGLQVQNARAAFEMAGQAVGTLLEGQVGKIETRLKDHISTLDTNIASHATLTTERFEASTREMLLALAAQSNRINTTLVENGRALGETLQSQVHEVAKQLETFDQTMGGRLQGVEALLTIHGDALVDRVSARTAETAASLEQQLETIDGRIRTRSDAFTSTIDTLAARIETGLTAKSEQLNELLIQRSVDLVRSLSDAGRATGEALTERGAEVVASIESQMAALNTRVVQPLETISGEVEARTSAMVGNVEKTTAALSALLSEQGEKLVGGLQETGARTVLEIARAGTSALEGLDQRQVKLVSEIDQRIGSVSTLLESRTIELDSRIQAATTALKSIIVDGSEEATRSLTLAAQKLGTDVSDVMSRLADANAVLNTILAAATTNLDTVESTLTDKVRSLETAMGDIVADTATTADRVEKQIGLLRDVSVGVLKESGVLSEQIQARGAALARAAEELAAAQARMGQALEVKGDELKTLVQSLETRRDDIENVLSSFGGLLEQHLQNAEDRSRMIGGSLSDQAETTSNLIREQFDALKLLTQRERDRTLVALKSVADDATLRIGNAFGGTTDQFRQAADELKQLTQDITSEISSARAQISRELEATRAEVARNAISMPKDIEAQSSTIRRVVTDHAKVIAALDDVARKDPLDVAPPASKVAPTRAPSPAISSVEPPIVPTPLPRTAAKPVSRTPLKSTSQPTSTGGWLSDLLTKASRDDTPALRGMVDEREAASSDVLGNLSDEIGRLMDSSSFSDAWERAMSGEQHVFSRQLYTLQGQRAFDEIRRRYQREAVFQEAIDAYIDDFDRLLKSLSDAGKDDEARDQLFSRNGMIYTLLGHAAGRIS